MSAAPPLLPGSGAAGNAVAGYCSAAAVSTVDAWPSIPISSSSKKPAAQCKAANTTRCERRFVAALISARHRHYFGNTVAINDCIHPARNHADPARSYVCLAIPANSAESIKPSAPSSIIGNAPLQASTPHPAGAITAAAAAGCWSPAVGTASCCCGRPVPP